MGRAASFLVPSLDYEEDGRSFIGQQVRYDDQRAAHTSSTPSHLSVAVAAPPPPRDRRSVILADVKIHLNL